MRTGSSPFVFPSVFFFSYFLFPPRSLDGGEDDSDVLDEDGSFNRISFGDSMNLDDKLRYYEHTCSRRARA